jgi:DNA-binding MarR family transcriptional regulator
MDAIRRIVQSLRLASRESEGRLGLSAAQLFVLQKLEHGGGASLNELAERTLTHQSSVSVVVQRLVERGLITRARSPRDGRQVVLSLTAAGRALIRRSPQAAQDRLIGAIARISRRHRVQLAQMLETIADATGAARPALFFEESVTKNPERKRNGTR